LLEEEEEEEAHRLQEQDQVGKVVQA